MLGGKEKKASQPALSEKLPMEMDDPIEEERNKPSLTGKSQTKLNGEIGEAQVTLRLQN